MNPKTITVCGLILLLTSNLYSALIWTAETGWHTEGGVIEDLIGRDVDAKNALEYLEKARAAQEKKSYRKALRTYKKVFKKYPLSLLAPEALYQSGRIHQTKKSWVKAFKSFDRLAKRYPDYDKYAAVIEAQFEIATAFMEGARLKIFGFIPGFRSPGKAIEYYETLIANAPYSKYAPIALINIATIARKQGNDEIEIDALERLIDNYPDSNLAAEAHLSLAETLSGLVKGPEYDQGIARKAISSYQDYLLLYPKGDQVAQAEAGRDQMDEVLAKSKFLIAEFYYIYRNDTQAALNFYSEAITVAPKSPSAEKARERFKYIESGGQPPVAPGSWLLGPPKAAEKRTL